MNKKIFIENLQRRAKLLQPATRERLSQYFDSCMASLDNKEIALKTEELLKQAFVQKDAQAFQTLMGIRIISIGNYVTAMSNAKAFFEEVNLAIDETPWIRNETTQETRVRFVGQDGKVDKTQAIRSRSQFEVPLRLLSTEPVEFPLWDLQKGMVLDQGKAQYDIAFDLAMKVDLENWALIKAAIGAFRLTGPKHLRTFNFHSSVNIANLPTTNLITPASNTGASKFRFDAIKAAIKWCSQWGTNALSSGEVVPVTFYVPSLHVGDLLDEIDIDSPDNAMVREIKDVGHVLSVGGKSINIVPDATLDPTEYAAYVRTNRPLGTHFRKTSLDRIYPGTLQDIRPEDWQANRVEMSMTEVYGAVVPEQNRVGVLKVVYKN